MKIRNIFLMLFLLLACVTYASNCNCRDSETSSGIELYQDNAILDGALVLIDNPEIASFNIESLGIPEIVYQFEVLVVLKHPISSVVFPHYLETPITGYHNLKDLFIYSRIDEYLTMG